MLTLTHPTATVQRLNTASNAPLQANLAAVAPFIPRGEMLAIRHGLTGEEHGFFIDKLADLANTITTMPKSYQTEDMGDEAIVHLHYFRAGSDWFITELDSEGDGRQQAFGYVVLNGDRQNAELGYISIAELVAHNVELDLYWTKRDLGLVKEAISA